MFFQRPFAVLLESIVFSLSPIPGFHPVGLKQSPGLHAMEHRVKHPIGPLKLVSRAGLNLLNDRIAIALASGEQRQNQRFRGGGHQFFRYHAANIHSLTMYVKRENVSSRLSDSWS